MDDNYHDNDSLRWMAMFLHVANLYFKSRNLYVFLYFSITTEDDIFETVALFGGNKKITLLLRSRCSLLNRKLFTAKSY